MLSFQVLSALFATPSIAILPPNRGSSLTSLSLEPPAPAPGESLVQWMDHIFEHSESSSEYLFIPPAGRLPHASAAAELRDPPAAKGKRSSLGTYVDRGPIHELSWQNETDQTSFNITINFGPGCTGLHLNADVGVYTYTNGTTSDRTLLKDLIIDIWRLRPTQVDRSRRYANHTAAIAELALAEAETALGGGLICPGTASGQPNQDLTTKEHNELRHLLANRWSYWTATILSAFGGGIAGGGVAAISGLVFTGNVTAQNVVQTAAVVATSVIISGILNRLHEIGRLDGAQMVAQNAGQVGVQSRQAIMNNVYMSWARRQLRRVIQREIEVARSNASSNVANIGSVGDPSSPGGGSTPGGGGSTPGGGGSSGRQSLCMSEDEAAAAATALDQMSDAELRLATIQEVERMEQGYGPDPSCPTSGAGPSGSGG